MYSNMIENIIMERDKYKNGVLKLNGFLNNLIITIIIIFCCL